MEPQRRYIGAMIQEVHGLGEFYSSPGGQVAARLLRRRLRALWPDLRGLSLLGLGYASPYLRLWREEAHRCLCLVPGHLRPWRWPRKSASLTAIAEEDSLPFPDLVFDRVLLVHGLETAENTRRMLREAWRVLKDDGRLLVVVPNRLGIWAHRETTPFGHGQPFSVGQLEALLKRQMFRVRRRDAALFAPPFRSRLMLRTAGAWDRLGGALYPSFGGLTLIEAQKDMFAGLPAETALARRPRRVLVVDEGAWSRSR
jgi:SAM-dependent methyltransferase